MFVMHSFIMQLFTTRFKVGLRLLYTSVCEAVSAMKKSHCFPTYVLHPHNYSNNLSVQWTSCFSISGPHLCLHMVISSAQHIYHLSRIICKYPIAPVVKCSILVEHGQKEPHTYCLDPEYNKEEP